MAEVNTKIKLKEVGVIFYNPEDNGFGTSITIDCTKPEVKGQIEKWVKENNIGKETPGEAKIKEYTNEKTGETTLQYAFKINDKTKYAGVNGLTENDLGYGAVIDIIATAYTYNNKFTAGKDRVGQSASAIVIRSGATSGGDADLAELLGEMGEEADSEVKKEDIPF